METPDLIDRVVALGTAVLGDDQPAATTIRQRLNKDHEGLAATEVGGEVVAYQLVYPLSAAGLADIDGLRVRRGAALEPQHLAPTAHAHGFYLAVLASRPPYRTRAVRLMAAHLTGLVHRAPQATHLYGRAATAQGGRLLTRLGFVELPAPSLIRSRAVPEHLPPIAGELASRHELHAFLTAMVAAEG